MICNPYAVCKTFSETRNSANAKRTACAVAEILKGNPEYMGASLSQGHAHFSSGFGFMVGLGKPKLRTKFEVVGFIYYGNTRESVLNDKFSL